MSDVYGMLRDQGLRKTAGFPDEDFMIRGLWKVDLAFRPNVHERTFRYAFLLSQTVGQGSCYCDTDLVINDDLIGRDAREVVQERDCYSISLLDSIYASIPKQPDDVHEIRGSSIEKAAKRNAIILDEIGRLLGVFGPKSGKPRVLNVGVVGNVVHGLVERGYDVLATDLDEKIIGSSVHGVTVVHGSRTYQHLKSSDVAVITGMTLATDAVGDIAELSKVYNTRVVMFAETGANFGEEYCQSLGIDVVVSEPFPFYIFQGVSRIEVYRRKVG